MSALTYRIDVLLMKSPDLWATMRVPVWPQCVRFYDAHPTTPPPFPKYEHPHLQSEFVVGFFCLRL